MKFEHLINFNTKLTTIFFELKFFFLFQITTIKIRFLTKWQVSSFADYYWFLFSNKNFTFLNKYL
uniref:Uncharacterized protein n=1 Tax=Oxytricha trifallax TaxID=1172189 RepID=G9HRF2_9SPIT|nr:hypothetical protein [Oxytricha trifallax]